MPNEELYWWASHHSRTKDGTGEGDKPSTSTDTMYVVIMDAELAAQYVTTQDQIQSIVDAAKQQQIRNADEVELSNQDSFTENKCKEVAVWIDGVLINATVWQLTSDATKWHDYGAMYEVPEGQYLTRFFFAAGDTGFDNPTVGNLIDNVGFSQYPPTVENQGRIVLTKALVGVDAATEIPAETFTFSVTAQGSTEPVETVKLPSEDATLSNTAAWTAIVDVPAGTYTVTETEPQDIGEQWAYKTTTNTINAQDKAGLATDSFVLHTNETLPIEYTNTYEEAVASLTITKNVVGDDEHAGSFQIEVTGPAELAGQTLKAGDDRDVRFDGNAKTTVTLNDGGSITIMGLPRNETYTVQESTTSQGDIDLDGESTVKKDYYLDKTEYKINDAQPSETSAQVTLESDTTVTVTNSYKPYKTLTVEKIVTGEMGSSSDYFDFSATKLGEDGESQVDVTLVGANAASDSANYDFKLKSGDTVTIVNLKENDEVTISEAANDNRGYTAKAPTLTELNSGVIATSERNTSVKVTVPNGTVTDLGTVTFNNHREAVAPTGLESNHTTPYVLMITAAGMAGLALIGGMAARRIRRRRED